MAISELERAENGSVDLALRGLPGAESKCGDLVAGIKGE